MYTVGIGCCGGSGRKPPLPDDYSMLSELFGYVSRALGRRAVKPDISESVINTPMDSSKYGKTPSFEKIRINDSISPHRIHCAKEHALNRQLSKEDSWKNSPILKNIRLIDLLTKKLENGEIYVKHTPNVDTQKVSLNGREIKIPVYIPSEGYEQEFEFHKVNTDEVEDPKKAK